MVGYYKNKKATEEVFTKDGFFRTGDIAVIDERRLHDDHRQDQGHHRHRRREKHFAAEHRGQPQGHRCSSSRWRIIGDKRKYLSALVVPTFPELEKWAKDKGIAYSSHTDLINNEAVQKLFRSEIDTYTAQYARVEQIRKFKLLDAEWTQATGELTPTQKVKRKIINQKYAKEIEEMYAGEGD